ncbi:MAG: acylphosphatase [Oscillospiraceae bacterium]|nr:acylphosphatase [Oscillospiraceae bacterium]
MIRQHLIFFGIVQGVGFRWRAMQAAKLYCCTGWVRNDYDGSVTMELQGTRPQIDKVLLALRSSRYTRIDRVVDWEIPIIPDERGFQVDYV